jgi:hypothetical protein
VYILIVGNFMNQILGKLRKETCADNPHTDNREYTVLRELKILFCELSGME